MSLQNILNGDFIILSEISFIWCKFQIFLSLKKERKTFLLPYYRLIIFFLLFTQPTIFTIYICKITCMQYSNSQEMSFRNLTFKFISQIQAKNMACKTLQNFIIGSQNEIQTSTSKIDEVGVLNYHIIHQLMVMQGMEI